MMKASQLQWIPFAVLLFILPFPGTVALRLLCLATAFVIAIGFWRKQQPPTFPGKPFFALWIFLSLLSLGYAVDPRYSLGEIKNEIGYTMMALFAFYVYFDDKRKVILGAWAVVLALAVISVWALSLLVLTGVWRDNAGHGGLGTFVGLVLMAVPAIVLIWHWQPSARWLVVAILLLGVLAAAYGRQRAFWPALGAELALLVILLQFKKGAVWPARRAIVSLLLIAAAGLIFLLATQGARIGASGGEVALENDVRLRYWPAVIERIGEQPMIGAGFGRNAMKLGHSDLVPASGSPFWHAHNIFLNYGLAMGIPGIIALVLLFASLALTYWRMYRAQDPVLAILGIVGLMLLASVPLRNFSNDFFQRDVALLFWSMNGVFLGFGLRLQRQIEKYTA